MTEINFVIKQSFKYVFDYLESSATLNKKNKNHDAVFVHVRNILTACIPRFRFILTALT